MKTFLRILGTVFIAAALCIGCLLLYMYNAAHISDTFATKSYASSTSDNMFDSQFSDVDFYELLKVNSDVIAWVEVPGTDVSYPVIGAARGQGDYYLHHDIYGNYNIYGAIYLDEECNQDILSSPNAIVYGHHMDDGSMFAQLAQYSDEQWAREHDKVLVQTPEHKVVYQVCAVDIINAYSDYAYTDFDDVSSYRKWADDAYESSAVQLNELTLDRTLSLVTCSYHFFSNERTVIYCQPVEVDGIKITGDTQADVLLGVGNIPYKISQ